MVSWAVGRWPLLDQIVGRLLGTDELKFGVMVAVFYWLWFRYDPPDLRKRVILLPFRERPFARPVGLLAFVHAALIICMPRLYYGLHHPSDL